MLDRIRNLFRNLAIYGFGDVATSIVSLLLLPIYTRYLTPSDYGVIAMLLTIEAVAKVLFRWGVDTAFMRLYYDCADQPARQRLASTIFFFLLAVNGSLLAVGLLGASWLRHTALRLGARGDPHRAGHRQYLRRRPLLHPVPGSAHQREVEAVHRAGFRALGCNPRSAPGSRHRCRHGRPGRRGRRRRGDGVLHGHPQPLVRTADSPGILAFDPARSPALSACRASPTASRIRSSVSPIAISSMPSARSTTSVCTRLARALDWRSSCLSEPSRPPGHPSSWE